MMWHEELFWWSATFILNKFISQKFGYEEAKKEKASLLMQGLTSVARTVSPVDKLLHAIFLGSNDSSANSLILSPNDWTVRGLIW